MAIYLSNRDGGKTDEQGHYKFQTNAFTGNVLDGGLLVTQNSPLAMNVKVSGGDARIPYSDYAYTAWIPAGAPETVTVTTANPSNPRIDRLVMYVDRGETPSSATANNPTLCKLMLVAGTPAGSPSRPSNGTVDTAVSNNPYIDLADIRVNAGVTQITDADITDTRVLVGAPIANGSVTAPKIDFGGAGSGVWWEEIGRTTLTVAGDTITVSGLPARNYLTIIFRAEDTGGTIGGSIRFNNDSGTNYAERYSVGNAADTTATSQTSALFRGGTGAYPQHAVGTVRNLAAEEKVQYWWGVNPNTDGAGNIPGRVEGVMKWANKVNQISRVDVINNGAGDFAIGSEVIVLGHD